MEHRSTWVRLVAIGADIGNHKLAVEGLRVLVTSVFWTRAADAAESPLFYRRWSFPAIVSQLIGFHLAGASATGHHRSRSDEMH